MKAMDAAEFAYKNGYERGYEAGWYSATHPTELGEWHQTEFLSEGGTWKCSVCGRQITFNGSNPQKEHMYFCPECGTRMNVEIQND